MSVLLVGAESAQVDGSSWVRVADRNARLPDALKVVRSRTIEREEDDA
jgi:hypothetical protein